MIGIVTHGVLSGAALQRVEETEGLEVLVVTNTIPQVQQGFRGDIHQNFPSRRSAWPGAAS